MCARRMNDDTTYRMYDEYTTMLEKVYSASSGDAAAMMRLAPRRYIATVRAFCTTPLNGLVNAIRRSA